MFEPASVRTLLAVRSSERAEEFAPEERALGASTAIVPLEEASTAASSGNPSEASAPAFSSEVDKAMEAAQSWRQDLAEARRAFTASLAEQYGAESLGPVEEAAEGDAEGEAPEDAAPEDAEAADVDALLEGNARALQELQARGHEHAARQRELAASAQRLQELERSCARFPTAVAR